MRSAERSNLKLKKTIITLSMAATVGLSTAFTGVLVDHAAASSKIEDLQNKSNEIRNKKAGVEDAINQKAGQIKNIHSEQDKVTADINRIDLAIGDTETKITEKGQQIDEKNVEINKLNGEIKVLTDRIEQRNELLKERARSYQENGGMVSYVDVLVGAQSFSDFIDRVGAVATILEADQNIMKEQTADKESLEQKQAQVKADLTNLENMKQELETLKSSLDGQKQEKSQLMASLEKQEVQASEEKVSLEESNEILAGQEKAIQRAIALEQERQAQIRKQQEAAALAASQNRSSTNKSSSQGQNTVATVPVSSGAFTRPAAGRLSSGFGNRSFNGGGFHYGVDIANSGTVPVVAAADGVVIRSYVSSSYGNCIMISHSINGQTYTTVYAHLSSRSVSDGAVVSKGQFIGYMGNTGDSYGQHLHFELHRGAWNQAKSNAINPLGIVF